MRVPHYRFISLSPTFHPVCSSRFVSDNWISVLTIVAKSGLDEKDWRRSGVQLFRLLSTLCQLANGTATDAVQRFITRSIVTSKLLSELDFNILINTTFNQFIQSIIIDFGLLVDIVHLLTQVDQPLVIDFLGGSEQFQAPDSMTNANNDSQSSHVCFHSISLRIAFSFFITQCKLEKDLIDVVFLSTRVLIHAKYGTMSSDV